MSEQEKRKINKPGLVIGRKVGESFVIFVDDMEIDVILDKVQYNRASIRIIAPKDIEISRSELLEEYDDNDSK